MSVIKVTKDNTLAETPFVKLVNREYLDKNGDKKEWTFVQRQNDRKAVVIVALYGEKMDKIVVTKEFRVPINDYEWGLPAGLIDEGESIEDTAGHRPKAASRRVRRKY